LGGFSEQAGLAVDKDGRQLFLSNMAEKKNRYIPSMRTVREAAQSLPEPKNWRAETYQVPMGEERLIEFRKVPIKTKEGKKDRWIYDGKLFVTRA